MYEHKTFSILGFIRVSFVFLFRYTLTRYENATVELIASFHEIHLTTIYINCLIS